MFIINIYSINLDFVILNILYNCWKSRYKFL